MADFEPMEDYGGPGDQEDIPEAEQSQRAPSGQRPEGPPGDVGDVSRPGEQFGEFDDSGTGTDLTLDMANTDERNDLLEEER